MREKYVPCAPMHPNLHPILGKNFSFSRFTNDVFNISNNRRTFSRGPVSWASLFVAGVVGVGIYGYYSKTVGKALLGGPFQMVDSEGVPVTNETFKGQWMVLYFGFTYCPDICPNELVKLGKVLNRLDKDLGPVVTPVFISVDPKRDSVKQLAFYKKDFHPRMRFLTGTPEQVKRAAKAYRVYYSNTNTTSDEDDWDYLVDHSIVMYFISPEGEFLEFFTQSADVDEIVDRMSAHIKR